MKMESMKHLTFAGVCSQRLTWLNHYLVYLVVRFAFCIIQAIPIRWCERFANTMAVLLNDWIPFRRKVIHDNLIHVFPDHSDQQILDISRQMWSHLILMACEVAHAPRSIHETNWRAYFSIENRKAIVGAMLDRRPVVLVAGHFGNFELGGFISGLLGVPTYTVARELDNPFLHRFMNEFRQRSGQFILPKDGSGDLVEVALQQGHTMTLLGDQYAGDKGVWVNFLGRQASCHKALALFTLTSGAPMVVVATRRTSGPMKFAIDFGGTADPLCLASDQQSVKGLTEWYNSRMAEQIMASPGQYWWVHRRWKPKQKKAKPIPKQIEASKTAPALPYSNGTPQSSIAGAA